MKQTQNQFYGTKVPGTAVPGSIFYDISKNDLYAYGNLKLPKQITSGLFDFTSTGVQLTNSLIATSGAATSLGIKTTTTETGAFNRSFGSEITHTGSKKGSYLYANYSRAEMAGTGGFDGVLYGAYSEARYSGSGTNISWSSMYGSQSKAKSMVGATGDIGYMIGANISSEMLSTGGDVEWLQGVHINTTLSGGNVSGAVSVALLDFDYTAGVIDGDFAYLQIQNDNVPAVSGHARAINSDSLLPSVFQGNIQAKTLITPAVLAANLPANPVAGERAFVTDANSVVFLATVVGGGSNNVPVVYNGSEWVIG